ncbi:MAG TPA: class I SAM-dependent methyltransferase [bacterium]|nr:class I SAM-dependent methyltransferase [bacterium]
MDSIQKKQEDQYCKPYHYFIEKNSWTGLFYYSYMQPVINYINSKNGLKILDAGCGDGFFEYSVNNKNHIFGVDYSEKAIEFAKIFNNSSTSKEFFCQSIETTNFPDNYFDVVVNLAVFEHIEPEKCQNVLEEFGRVLKSDGELIMAIPTKNLSIPKKHYRHFDYNEIELILKEKNFSIKNYYYVFNKRFNIFFKFIENRFFRINFLFRHLPKFFNLFFAKANKDSGLMLLIFCEKLK